MGVWLLWPGVYGYYAQWLYASSLHLWASSVWVLLVAVGVWGLLRLFCRNIQGTNVAFILSTVIAYGGVTGIRYLLGGTLEKWTYFLIVGCGGGIGLFLASRVRSFSTWSRFLAFGGGAVFMANWLLWPTYRALISPKATFFAELSPSMEGRPARSIYFFLLDEHPSPTVLKALFPRADTLLEQLEARGFVCIDSVWASPASTLHTLARLYQPEYGYADTLISSFGFLRFARLSAKLAIMGYFRKGILPYYPPLQQLSFEWEGLFWPTQLMADWEWGKPFKREIKHFYDTRFLQRLSMVVREVPSAPTFYYLHFFVTHAPFSTGEGGSWQALHDQTLYSRIRGAMGFTAQTLLRAIDTLYAYHERQGQPLPIVIVLSDHGLHLGEPERLGVRDTYLAQRLKHQAFFAVHVPDREREAVRSLLKGRHGLNQLASFIESLLGSESKKQ